MSTVAKKLSDYQTTHAVSPAVLQAKITLPHSCAGSQEKDKSFCDTYCGNEDKCCPPAVKLADFLNLA